MTAKEHLFESACVLWQMDDPPSAVAPAVLDGRAFTLCIRLRDTGGWRLSNLLCWGDIGKREGFCLSALDDDGIKSLAFDLETDWDNSRNERPLRVSVPVDCIGSDIWHDIVVRFAGPTLELFVDGVLVDEEWPVGALRLPENIPLTIGSLPQPSGDEPGFRGLMDHVAIWNRALDDESVAVLSGGKENVRRRDREILGAEAPTLNYWKPRGHNTSVGDCMPFSYDGRFHLFYLFDRRHHGSKWGLGAHQWAHASSTDLVHWEHHPLAAPVSRPWEGSICTGSVFYHDGTYYAFYSARMHDGTPGQLTASTSTDGVNFTKGDPLFTLHAPYEPVSARDPNIVRDPATGLFHMLVTTEVLNPPVAYRGGCLAHMVSSDLQHWEQEEPFIVPGQTCQPECPDLFEWNGRYYLFVGIEGVTKYRMSESLHGPWECPPVDVVDSPRAYVMKTASFTGGRRIGVAWIGHRNAWGGHTLFREILQNDDGTLGYAWVPEMIPASGEPVAISPVAVDGDVTVTGQEVSIRARSGFGAAAVNGVPGNMRLCMRVVPEPNSTAFGIAVRGSGNYAQGCELRIEPGRRKVGWRPCVSLSVEEREQNAIYEVDGIDRPFMLDVIVKDDILDVCVDGRRTLVTRAWPPCDKAPEPNGAEGDSLFLFAYCGEASFENIEVRPLL